MRLRGYVTPQEVATRTNRTVQSVLSLLRRERLQGTRIGRAWYVSWASVLRYLGPEGAKLYGGHKE
jgi:hypothetical protein